MAMKMELAKWVPCDNMEEDKSEIKLDKSKNMYIVLRGNV